MLPKLSLVLGGARSGKSAFAENLVLAAGGNPVYLATAQAHDQEMAARIAAHKQQRSHGGWTTIEEPLDLSPALNGCGTDDIVLLDCATLWLSNLMMAERDIAEETSNLLAVFDRSAARIVVVSNEIGLGVVPDNALARRFRDAQGQLNQLIAAKAGLVAAVMAGLPLALKGQLP